MLFCGFVFVDFLVVEKLVCVVFWRGIISNGLERLLYSVFVVVIYKKRNNLWLVFLLLYNEKEREIKLSKR